MGSRADLCGASGRPFHLLRRQVPATVGPGPARRRARPDARGALEAQLLGLRTAQADQGGPACRPRRRAGPGGPPHALPGHPRGQPGQEALQEQVRPGRGAHSGPRQPQLQRLSARCPLGDRFRSTWSGIVYVAFVIEVFSRRRVGWKAARSMTATLVIDALNMAACPS